MPDFADLDYWTTRFSTETEFEWLLDSEQLLPFILPSIKRQGDAVIHVLHLGSGTSNLADTLVNSGLYVVNVDFEEKCLLASKLKGRQCPSPSDGAVDYVVANGIALPFTRIFDLVVDKSTIDAISCAGDEAVVSALSSVRSVISEAGAWVCCSYSSARFDVNQNFFSVEVSGKAPRKKQKANEPDLFYWIYLLKPI